MKKYLIMVISTALLVLNLGACTTNEKRNASIAGGAVVGGVAGNLLTGGSAAGTVVGAAVGGVAGNELSK